MILAKRSVDKALAKITLYENFKFITDQNITNILLNNLSFKNITERAKFRNTLVNCFVHNNIQYRRSPTDPELSDDVTEHYERLMSNIYHSVS